MVGAEPGLEGLEDRAVSMVQSLYEDIITIVVVNKLGKVMLDKRGSLKQRGCASTMWVCFVIDPPIRYLERRLHGKVIT